MIRHTPLVLLLCAPALERAAAATIQAASVCVDASAFRFQTTLTEDSEEVIFRIGADSDPFVSPNERIAVNFDPDTGAITRAAPEVQTFGTPVNDRWVDGPISDFTIEAGDGDGVWQVSGSVPHGPDRFQAGDSVFGVAVRAGSTIYSGALTVAACEPAEPVGSISVPFNTRPPRLDGKIDAGEWDFAGLESPQIQLPNGSFSAYHDRIRLYILVNMIEDDTDDPVHEGGSDQLTLLFDVDENGAPTPNVDKRYRLQADTGNLRYDTFTDTAGTGFTAPADRTFSARAEGFNCFFADESATILPFLSCNAHRVWEIAIDLREIDIVEDRSTRLGLEVQSAPGTIDRLPADLSTMTAFIEVLLEGDATLFRSSSEQALDTTEVRISQAVQTAASDLALVADRPAWADVRVGGPSYAYGIANVFLSRGGVDMPGSPLAYSFNVPAGETKRRFLPLPEDAVGGGQLTVALHTRQPNIAAVRATSPQYASFVTSETPTYWVVPFNTGTTDEPELADEDYIRRNELETSATFPVPDIDWVRRPDVVDDPAGQDDAIDALNKYDQQALLAWTFGLLFTGSEPFDLPDQIVGVFPLSRYGNIGRSDPVWWQGGGARVSWIQETTLSNLNIPHEINHNLDTDPAGTWGRHVPGGCGATGPDPQWPYADDDIQEPGLSGRPLEDLGAQPVEPPVTVEATTPDFMSYCTHFSQYPSQWISPYRWNNMFQNVFGFFIDVPPLPDPGPFAMSASSTQSSGPTVQDTFYVTGQVNVDGTAALDPVVRQPGIARAPQVPGDYALELRGCDSGIRYSKSFGANFANIEGGMRDAVPITMVLADPGGVCAIELRHQGQVLAKRTVTPNVPEVRLLNPNGGEQWTGTETVRWEATDDDGDTLTASLLFSPDGGATWLPIAGRVSDALVAEVDSTTLPGTADARLRVLVTDGVNTAYDDSDVAFSVAAKPPAVSIDTPEDGALLVAGEPTTFRGIARTPQGMRLPADDYLWILDGANGLGRGDAVTASLTEGEHVVTLQVTNEHDLTGEDSVRVNVLPSDTAIDPVNDTGSAGVDLRYARVHVDDGRLACDLTIASRTEGLPERADYACLLDFHDREHEAETGCDANGDGDLDDTYRLGSNNQCETADVEMHFRVMGNGGHCTGPGDTSCTTVEVDADGNTDGTCDGEVNGGPALRCRVLISTGLDAINAERAAACGAEADCLPVRNGQASAYGFFTSHIRGDRDRLPDTTGDEHPRLTSEADEVSWPAR